MTTKDTANEAWAKMYGTMRITTAQAVELAALNGDILYTAEDVAKTQADTQLELQNLNEIITTTKESQLYSEEDIAVMLKEASAVAFDKGVEATKETFAPDMAKQSETAANIVAIAELLKQVSHLEEIRVRDHNLLHDQRKIIRDQEKLLTEKIKNDK